MMTIKIYDGMAGFTSTGRVLATLFEKEVSDFVFVKVDLSTGQHKTPEYLQLQPFGVIPVFVDGSLTLFGGWTESDIDIESRAIARFVAHKYEGQGTPLYGSSPKDKALVETDEALVEANLEKLKKVLDVYEGHLSKSKYLAGDFFSLADLSHLPYTQYLIDSAKLGDLIYSRPHVKAWWNDISSRPAWKKVLDLAAEHLASKKAS